LRGTFRPFFLSGDRRRRLFDGLRGLSMPIGPATTWARVSCEIADVDRTLASAISLIGYHTHELALATRRHDQKKERENRVFLNADTMIVSAYLEEVKDRKLTCEHFPRTAIAVAEDLEAVQQSKIDLLVQTTWSGGHLQ
jgi:hypothetical protein